MSAASADPAGEPRSRTWLIVVVAVVVLCCLCVLCSGLFWSLYSYGDSVFRIGAASSAVVF